MTSTRIAGNDGIAWALAPFLERLADLAIRDQVSGARDRIVESVVDLVESLCLDAIGDEPLSCAHPRAELLLRARAHASARLDDPSLTPADVASATHISTRYLHRLFEAEGLTVSAWIRRRRLEGCRRDLGDPARRNETVTSIGARWGLMNPSHLSRLFREEYGISPSEYRAARLLARDLP
jgi:AraC-like DNA-binding protein